MEGSAKEVVSSRLGKFEKDKFQQLHEDNERRQAEKIKAVIKWQKVLRGAVIRHRYRDMIDRRTMFKNILAANELVVLSSVVMHTNMKRPKKYCLIFTSKNRFILTDPAKKNVKTEMKFNQAFCKVTAAGKRNREFTIIAEHKGKTKTLKITDLLNKATTWIVCSKLNCSTEDLINIGFDQLLQGKVKTSSIETPIMADFLSLVALNKKELIPQLGFPYAPLFSVLIKKGYVYKLAYYKTEKDENPYGWIPINRSVKIKLPAKSAVENLFNINLLVLEVDKTRTVERYALQAKTKQTFVAWLKLITHCSQKVRVASKPIGEIDKKRSEYKQDFDASAFLKAFEDIDNSTLQNLRYNI